MNGFLWIMVIGLVGLVLMAIPGLRRHGPGHLGHLGHTGHGGHAGHVGHTGHVAQGGRSGPAHHAGAGRVGRSEWLRVLPQPQTVFSLLVLLGAIGNLLEKLLPHWAVTLVVLVALVPAVGIQAALIAPMWRFFLRFSGRPASPLETLAMQVAQAVTPFHNGRGLVEVERDGRAVQLSARLSPGNEGHDVHVGDKLRIDEVDPKHERVVVSVL